MSKEGAVFGWDGVLADTKRVRQASIHHGSGGPLLAGSCYSPC